VTRLLLLLWFAGCGAGSIPRRVVPDAAGLDTSVEHPSSDSSIDLATDSAIQPGPDAAVALVCEQAPVRRLASGTGLELAIQVRLGTRPLVFGEPNPAPGGGTLTPLNLRFFLSHLALLTGAGAVPVDLVDASGRTLPYGVHLFNAEEVGTARVHALVPPGSYTGISFTWGLDEACNATDPHGNVPPLTDSSQMTWPHSAGYLFLRYEATVSGTVAAVLDKIHMGGLAGLAAAPTVRLESPVVVPASGSLSRTLEVSLDEMFKGANMKSDAPVTIPLPEVEAGDRLRSNLPAVQAFRLAP
jgi:hypothetical protein